jgi:hypothetical protein
LRSISIDEGDELRNTVSAPHGIAVTIGIAIVFLLAGCTIAEWAKRLPLGRSGSAALTPSGSAAALPGYVPETTWTDEPWPLTISEGTLACESISANLGRVTFTTGGNTYWVNGIAKAAQRYADLDEIWRDNPDIPGTKVNIGPLIDRGLALC